MPRPISNVIGFDDAPFTRKQSRVPVLGVVMTKDRMDGLVIDRVRRDGSDATEVIARMVLETPFYSHVRAVMLDGITLAGFNVVELPRLHHLLGIPVLVVMRRQPDFERIHAALIGHVRGGARKWRLIEQAGTPEPLRGVFVQRAGLTLAAADLLLQTWVRQGKLPEPLRLAHLIGTALVGGVSHGRA